MLYKILNSEIYKHLCITDGCTISPKILAIRFFLVKLYLYFGWPNYCFVLPPCHVPFYYSFRGNIMYLIA